MANKPVVAPAPASPVEDQIDPETGDVIGAPPTTAPDMTAFASLLGDAVAAGMAKHNAGTKKQTFGEYNRKHNAGRPALTRICFENGIPMNAAVLTPKEINLLNALDRTGTYLNRTVEVIVREEGADEVVELRWNCKTADQRNADLRLARDLEDKLTQIVAAQAEERRLAGDKEARAVSKRQ